MALTRKELETLVYKYPTKRKEGFRPEEQEDIIAKVKVHFPDINMKKYDDAMMGNTCMMDGDGKFIIYHCDVFNALNCAIDNRDLTLDEWD